MQGIGDLLRPITPGQRFLPAAPEVAAVATPKFRKIRHIAQVQARSMLNAMPIPVPFWVAGYTIVDLQFRVQDASGSDPDHAEAAFAAPPGLRGIPGA